MLNDIKKYISYLTDNNEGKESRKRGILIFFLVICLFLFNYFYLSRFADRFNFQVQSALSQLVFFKGISPYSQNISSTLANYFSAHSWIFKTFSNLFQLPIYQLIFFLPFSIIPDQTWSFSIWLTINQCLLLLSIEIFTQIFMWKPKNWIKTALMASALITFFGISNIFEVNTSVIQIFFLVIGLKSFFSENYIVAGLSLGIASVDPYNFFVPIIVILAFVISNKQFELLLWFIISTAMLSLTGSIFDSEWILKMVKNLLLRGSFYPFIDYNHALLNWILKLTPGDLINFVPILLLIWIFVEYSRIPKQNPNQLIWLLCLVSCINPFIIMRETNYAAVLYLIPLIFIIYLWNFHSSGLINKVLYGILFFTSVVIPTVILLFPGYFRFLANFHSINLINSILMIIILYWVRWWVVKPYDYLIHN
jgi:hypothetical protein